MFFFLSFDGILEHFLNMWIYIFLLFLIFYHFDTITDKIFFPLHFLIGYCWWLGDPLRQPLPCVRKAVGRTVECGLEFWFWFCGWPAVWIWSRELTLRVPGSVSFKCRWSLPFLPHRVVRATWLSGSESCLWAVKPPQIYRCYAGCWEALKDQET